MPRRKVNKHRGLGTIILFEKLKIVNKNLRKPNFSYDKVPHTFKREITKEQEKEYSKYSKILLLIKF